MRRSRRWIALACACLVALTGCGGDPGMTDRAATQLQQAVDELRAAAASGDRDLAAAELAELRQLVAVLTDGGELSSARAGEIVTAAAGVEQHLGELPAPPSPSPSPAPPPPPPPPPESDDEDDEKKRDEDKKQDEEEKRDEDGGEGQGQGRGEGGGRDD